jgi:enamine deaminase RidA (YjgF/YER057c/UK114 family)
MSREQRLRAAADRHGFDVDAAVLVGGRYAPLVRHGDLVYVSGQVPRIGERVVVVGAVGDDVSLEDARIGACISTLRVLALLRRSLGSLDAVAGVLRLGVYVRCTAAFTQHSEVADAASDLIAEVLGESGAHSRTSVGVLQLPKGAAVEVEATVSVRADA